MGTISPTLPTIGGLRGDEEADVRNALSALITEFNGNIESANMKNAPFVLLNTLTVSGGGIAVESAGTAQLDMRDTAAGLNVKRSRIRNAAGKTRWQTIDDAYTAFTDRMVLDHATGVVDFPTGMSIGGAGAGSIADNRGKSIIPATESRSNAAYGKLATPDQVTVTLATDGLLKVLFQATWQESVVGAAAAAIFVGANQLKMATIAASPSLMSAVHGAAVAGVDRPLASYVGGLTCEGGPGSTAYTGDVTTGQLVGYVPQAGGVVGGACFIFAAAGTYTISVQFKASSGSVTAKNRKLWVAAESY